MTANSIDIQNCGLKYDPVRGTFRALVRYRRIWELSPPATGNTTTGWSIVQRPAPPQPAPSTGPCSRSASWANGVMRPITTSSSDCEDINDGNVWIYKPVGLGSTNPPGNALPTVNVTSPAEWSHRRTGLRR